MKTKKVLLTVVIASFFLLSGCSKDDDNLQELDLLTKSASASHGSSEIHRAYPKEVAEVLATFGAIGASIMANNEQGLDDLIGFHDYAGDYGGYYFTEFNYDGNGVGHLFNGEDNEANERAFFGDNEVTHFATVGDPKVAVYYGNVANVTFISDFIVGGNQVDLLITLLFVKTKGEWKLVHEHHSPKELVASIGGTTSYPSEQADLSSKAQQEVLETFMAIRQTILDNSGTGPENMDELISFHAYGPKFTEFNYDGSTGYSFNSEDNEANERAFFGNYKVTQFAAKANTVNIVVYHENVANVTFISDFVVEGVGPINNLITLLFVKIKGDWKLVHEHHSPENV
jgi:hypothetical protein